MSPSKTVAVVLSGCGVYDGTEIHEAVSVLLRLSQLGIAYQCMAPDMDQAHVINHLTGQPSGEVRNVLVESARIARGQIVDIAKANPDDYAAVIFPGGFGAAKNLCDFAFKGADMQIHPAVSAFARAIQAAGKPAGLICIAPAMAPQLFGNDTQCTIGTDADTATAITAMGGQHVACGVNEVVIDEARRIITTPAYMLAGSIAEAFAGISRLVDEVVKRI